MFRAHVSPGHRKTPADILRPNTWAARPGATNPATLLNARYETVPFFEPSRTREVEALETWCNKPTPTSVRLFTGPGGAGKTRLFIEWARRLRDRGWDAGFLPDELLSTESANAGDVNSLLAPDRPTLVVIDYAESRPALREFLRRVAHRGDDGKAPLRIALLAREVADWWKSLLESDADVGHVLSEYEPLRLEAVPLENQLRQRVFDEARDKFAAVRGKPVPKSPVDLSDERFGRPLYLHMAALAAVEGLSPTADSLLHGIVTHEKRFWVRPFEDGHRRDFDRAHFMARASRTVAAVTLRGGVSTKAEAEALNHQVKGPSDDEFIRFLHGLYPGHGEDGQNNYLAGLEPDLLGEALVAEVLSDSDTSADYLENVFDGTPPPVLRNGFTVLGRISLHHKDQAAKWLAQVLNVDAKGRALPAFEAAMTLGGETALAPLGLILAKGLQAEGTVELAALFERRVPHPTVSLREVGLWATDRLLRKIASETPDEEALIESARLLNNLGLRLSDLGRREDALQATQQAVDIRRTLAQQRPDAFLPDLAMSLNNLGAMLSDLGRREDALQATQEAVDIYRTLAQQRPDAFLPDLAMSLNNLGNRLSELGRREDALQATQEAVDIRRTLAQQRPDAFLPDLAGSLNNLGNSFSELGRREDALQATQEAVEIYGKLAEQVPAAFGRNFIISLQNFMKRFEENGRPAASEPAIQRALEIQRKLGLGQTQK